MGNYVVERIIAIGLIVLDLVFYVVGMIVGLMGFLLDSLGLEKDITQHSALTYALAIVIIAAFTYLAVKIVSKWIYNSIIGLSVLLALKIIGVDVPITLFTIILVAFFGV